MRSSEISDKTAMQRGLEMEILEVEGTVEQPELGFKCHQMVQDLWDSLGQSAQAKYYEPSDWQYARFTCHVANKILANGNRINGAVLASLNSMFQGLMVTEESRRRAHLEIQRGGEEGKSVDEQLQEAIEKWTTG